MYFPRKQHLVGVVVKITYLRVLLSTSLTRSKSNETLLLSMRGLPTLFRVVDDVLFGSLTVLAIVLNLYHS
jgi:hypothetical protein